jgi:hypothetical protein
MDRKRKGPAAATGRGASAAGRGRGGSTSDRASTPGRGRGTSRGGASAGASSSSSGFRTPGTSGRGQSSGKQQPGSQPRYGRGGSTYRTPGSSAETRSGSRSRSGGFGAVTSAASSVPAGFPVISFSPAQPSYMAGPHKDITLDKEKEGYIWKVSAVLMCHTAASLLLSSADIRQRSSILLDTPRCTSPPSTLCGNTL